MTSLYVGGFYRTHESKDGWRTESIILTTQPNDTVAPIHDRMPLIIEEKDVERWIKDDAFCSMNIYGNKWKN
jgi:putative SOS response-associated peptidase YedK